MKSPAKPGDPSRYRDPHDKAQFARFQSLPVWAISNFVSLRVYRRDEQIDAIDVVPETALAPETSDAKAEKLIRATDVNALRALTPLAFAEPPPAQIIRIDLEARRVRIGLAGEEVALRRLGAKEAAHGISHRAGASGRAAKADAKPDITRNAVITSNPPRPIAIR